MSVSFYVSNSPWQLYNTINEYFQHTGLPPGSVHLKRYSGNIIASLLEPSSSRKRRALHKILQDFPDKNLCVLEILVSMIWRHMSIWLEVSRIESYPSTSDMWKTPFR